MIVSLILPTFKRANLLDLGLFSINQQKIDYPLEILVLNDGIHDDTKEVCKKYSNLNIRYLFTGQRNLDGQNKPRIPGFAINIGVKQCKGDIIILSSPEIYHLNNTINLIIEPLLNNKKIMSTPRTMTFDDKGDLTNYLINNPIIKFPIHIWQTLTIGAKGREAIQMPFLMGLYKEDFMEIGGYDEDLTGYACDDNDFVDRLKLFGFTYIYTNAQIIHLYHCEQNTTCLAHWDNPRWVYNYELYQKRKKIIKRNTNREWGKL